MGVFVRAEQIVFANKVFPLRDENYNLVFVRLAIGNGVHAKHDGEPYKRGTVITYQLEDAKVEELFTNAT